MAQEKIRQPKRIAVFFLKVVLFVGLFALFFGLFRLESPWIVAKNRTAAITMTTFIVVGICMLSIYGGYAVGKKKSREIIPGLCIASFITDVFTYFQLAIMNTNRWNEFRFSLGNLGILLLVLVGQCLWITAMVYLGNYVYFKLNPPESCVVICGDPERSEEIVRRMGRYKKQYRIEAVITPDDPELKPLIRANSAVFLYLLPADVKSEIIEYAYKHYTNIYFQTDLRDVVINYAKYFVLDDLSMLASNIKELSLEQRIVKRCIDIVSSLAAILLTSPIMLIEALCIKLYDGGPVFYKQERLTIYGKKFNVLKFRTMIVDAEKQSGAMLSTKNDSRITPVGKVLRAIRMDELPQFFNVLKGDMSMVGPRPEREIIAEEYYKEFPEFRYRLRAKAGLTGLAQIAGKYNTSPKDKLMLDLMYIERYSVWMDILLIFQTLQVFFKKDSTEGIDEEKKNALRDPEKPEE